MTESDFWVLVAEINWSDKCDYRAGKKFLMSKLSPEEAAQFENLAQRFQSKLKKVSGEGLCCDSWDDCTAHIVGLGQEEYERHVADPKLISERLERGDYTESFSYCIPWEDDYSKKNLSHFSE